jgi:hypothetical protein
MGHGVKVGRLTRWSLVLLQWRIKLYVDDKSHHKPEDYDRNEPAAGLADADAGSGKVLAEALVVLH